MSHTVTINISHLEEHSNYHRKFYKKGTAVSVLSETNLINELSSGKEVIFSSIASGNTYSYSRVGGAFASFLCSAIESELGESFIDKVSFIGSYADHDWGRCKAKYRIEKKEEEVRKSVPDWGNPQQMCIPQMGAQYGVNFGWEITMYNYSPNRSLFNLIFPINKKSDRHKEGFDGVIVDYGKPVGQLVIPQGTLFKITKINVYDLNDSRKQHVVIVIDKGQELIYKYENYINNRAMKIYVDMSDFNKLDSSINRLSIR